MKDSDIKKYAEMREQLKAQYIDSCSDLEELADFDDVLSFLQEQVIEKQKEILINS